MTNTPAAVIHQKSSLLARVMPDTPVFQLAQQLAELCHQHDYVLTRWQSNGKDPVTGKWFIRFTWTIYKGKQRPNYRTRGAKRLVYAEMVVDSEGNTTRCRLYKALMKLHNRFMEDVVHA